ncbi:MAG: ROK family protein [Robiginitomaculum sp.]
MTICENLTNCPEILLGKPSHPEFGHIRVERHPADINFDGVCAIHGACLEGLASGPSLHARFGDPEKLVPDHLAWDIIAFYLAQACISLSLSFRPEVIILGGGVMGSRFLLPKVRAQYLEQINNYLGQSAQDVDALIVAPGLGGKAGLWGGVYLALGAQ